MKTKSNKIQHTPTPWTYKFDEIHGSNCRIVYTCVRRDEQAKIDSEFIVRAVNNHELLLKALKEAYILLNRGHENIGPMNLEAVKNYLGRVIDQAQGKVE